MRAKQKVKAPDIKKNDACRVPVMERTQDVIEIEAIAPDGIFKVRDRLFSKVYTFANINYDILSERDKEKIMLKYMKLLQDLNTRYKITYLNQDIDYETFRKNILMPYKRGPYDKWRKALNDIMEKRMREGRQGVRTEFFYTISVHRATYEEAKNYFITLEKTLQNHLHQMGSVLTALDCTARLKLLYDFYHYGDKTKVPFRFDFDRNVETGRDFLDDIAPCSMTFHEDYFEMNSVYGRAFYVRSFPADLTDRFMQKMTDLPYHILASVDGIPMSRAAAAKLANEKYMDVEEKIRKQQQVRNKNNDFASEISKPVQDEKEAVGEIIDAMKKHSMSMFYCGVTIVVFAESKKELEMRTDAVLEAASGETVIMDTAIKRQREAVNTVLPVGITQPYKMRTMLSGAMTVFLPFTSQELMLPGGEWYGLDQLSHNMAVGNRRSLKNGNAWIFGVPGSGKSMGEKLEVMQNYLRHPNDDFIFIDPNNEYYPLVSTFDGAYIDVRPGSGTCLNGFEFPPGMDLKEVVAAKTAWMITVHTRCRQDELSAIEKGIVDRAVRALYQTWANGGQMSAVFPDMIMYRNILFEMDNEYAADMAEELAYFTEGSLNMFAQQTNVDTKKRIIVYGIRDISKDLLPVAMSTIMESLRSRVYDNYQAGRATWITIDEAHRLTKDDLSAEYLDMIWREFRKFYGFCTGISHQVGDVCRSEMSKELVRNSSFLWLFGQEDISPLQELGLFSDEQLAYVSNAEPGMGLLKHGTVIVPFDIRIPADSELYELLNTDPDRNVKKQVTG